MIINYKSFILLLRKNIRTLILFEIVFIFSLIVYFIYSPKIFEAYFEISNAEIYNQKGYWDTIVPALDIKRSLQNPLGFSSTLVTQCMGDDLNLNRKVLANSLNINPMQGGKRLGIAVRLEGVKNAENCANLILNSLINELNISLISLAAKTMPNFDTQQSSAAIPEDKIKRAYVALPVRMSDGYVKPDLLKLLLLGVVTGLFAAFFYIQLKAKYGEQ